MSGTVREREAARAEFAHAAAAGKHAGLVEQERPNVFELELANIPARGTVRSQLTYFEALPYANGEFEFRFPTVVAPRYSPVGGAERGTRPGGGDLPICDRAGHTVALSLWVDAGMPIESFHPLDRATQPRAQRRAHAHVVGHPVADGHPATRCGVERWREQIPAVALVPSRENCVRRARVVDPVPHLPAQGLHVVFGDALLQQAHQLGRNRKRIERRRHGGRRRRGGRGERDGCEDQERHGSHDESLGTRSCRHAHRGPPRR